MITDRLVAVTAYLYANGKIDMDAVRAYSRIARDICVFESGEATAVKLFDEPTTEKDLMNLQERTVN